MLSASHLTCVQKEWQTLPCISQWVCTSSRNMYTTWWAAENWTHYICHEPSGYHIETWPFPKAHYHYESCFHLTLWQMHVEMHYTSSIYLQYWSVWWQHTAHTDTFSPWSRICCNIYSYKWMQFRPFSWFGFFFFANSEMSMQTELVGKTWRNLAFPLSSLILELQVLFAPQPLEQIQTAGLLDLSHKFPNQQRNHATIQQLKCMCLTLPANPPVALHVQEAIPQPVLLHLKSIATQHFTIISSFFKLSSIDSFPPQCHFDNTVQAHSGIVKTQPLFWYANWQGCTLTSSKKFLSMTSQLAS